MLEGIVTRTEGPVFYVEIDGAETPCTLRGRLKKKHLRVTSLCVVGDRVCVSPEEGGISAIVSVEERQSELSRPGFHGYTHVIAANIDQLVIVQSSRQPAFKGALVDRFLVTAQRGNISPLLVVNKCDLEDPLLVESWVRPFRDNGVEVVLTSAASGQGVDELRNAIGGRTSAMAGQSGVGKSSLLNAMYPDVCARVGEVASWNNKGRHTTTSSRLYRLPGGGYLADTPGIRTLALFDEDEDSVIEAFPDIQSLGGGCRFRDCTHTHEPKCAVKEAVFSGSLSRRRYESYLRMLSKS